ncbi:MAG: hypothetical protein DRJ63_05640 [Thermoprotei archaeon]|nr:MAG: hypothetical protein DRJ63_05640 [Thermoprotei archaeon]
MNCPRCGGRVVEKTLDFEAALEKIPLVKSVIKLPSWLEGRVLRVLLCETCGYVVEIYLVPK